MKVIPVCQILLYSTSPLQINMLSIPELYESLYNKMFPKQHFLSLMSISFRRMSLLTTATRLSLQESLQETFVSGVGGGWGAGPCHRTELRCLKGMKIWKGTH